ncbi:MAG TPA: membrane protein insertase YidC, partial [Candidatus Binatia bacterium]|nr:membrane protein insertase YidC [Candidatus Binatia bacterium]
MTLRDLRSRALPLLLLGLLVLVIAACAAAPGGSPGASGAPASPTATPGPLQPAQPGADPFSTLAWLFTPIFQTIFIVLVGFYQLTKLWAPAGDIGIAIVLVTIAIRIPLVPLFRRQTVSMRQTQLLAPQVKDIQRRYKGDRQKIFEETQALYRANGISQFSGCLPLLLQLQLLFVMYQVIREGLTSYDI